MHRCPGAERWGRKSPAPRTETIIVTLTNAQVCSEIIIFGIHIKDRHTLLSRGHAGPPVEEDGKGLGPGYALEVGLDFTSLLTRFEGSLNTHYTPNYLQFEGSLNTLHA